MISSETFIWEAPSFFIKIIRAVKDIGYILLLYTLIELKKINATEYILLVIGFWAIYLKLFTDANEITSRMFLYTTVINNVGWGILTYKCFVNREIKSSVYFVFPVIVLLYSAYSLVNSTIQEAAKNIYIEYRDFIF